MPSLSHFFGSLHLFICLTAFFGNLMVFVAIYNTPSLRNRKSVSLVSLAVTDFLAGLILLPMNILQLFSKHYRLDCTFNLVRRKFSIFLTAASFSSIAFISYDRYIHLSKPFEYIKIMNRAKIFLIVALCWILSAALPFLGYAGQNETVFAAVFPVHAVINFAITLTYYIYIILIVKKRRKELVEDEPQSHRESRGIRRQLRVAKAASMIIFFSSSLSYQFQYTIV